jgi:2-methylcitrate dehydratase PrpD
LAATQPVGVREMFGSMTKSFHPGRAAQNGLLAAFLAEKGYTSSLQGIEARRGWARVVSAEQNWQAITNGLGEDFEINRNSYKPYACGLIVHPVIDGCIQLRNEHNLTAGMIERIVLDVDPIVLELTNKRTPQTGLEAKFSVSYSRSPRIRQLPSSRRACDFVSGTAVFLSASSQRLLERQEPDERCGA